MSDLPQNHLKLSIFTSINIINFENIQIFYILYYVLKSGQSFLQKLLEIIEYFIRQLDHDLLVELKLI